MRSGMLVTGAVLALLCVGILWYVTRPSSAEPIATTAIPASVLAAGDTSAVDTRDNYVITSADDLKRLWDLIETTTPEPTVDFTKDEVIAVFAGKEPSAGYAVQVASVADSATKRMVTVLIVAPGPSCGAAATTTTPYQVLEIPLTTLTLTHQDVATTTSCWGQ